MDWANILVPSAPFAELLVRGTLVFLGLMVLLRILGQREAGGLGLTDLLVVVLVVDAASAGLTGETHSVGDGFILVVTILFWSVVLDAVSYRWPRLGTKPLIEDGAGEQERPAARAHDRRRGVRPAATPWHSGCRAGPPRLSRAERHDQRGPGRGRGGDRSAGQPDTRVSGSPAHLHRWLVSRARACPSDRSRFGNPAAARENVRSARTFVGF